MLDRDARSYDLIARVFNGQREGLTRDDILDNVSTTRVALRPTSRRARAASGNGCTTTGPDPNRVVMTTTDSNLWGGGSGHTYTFTRRPDGMTDLDAVVVRDGKNLKGKLLGLVLGIFGQRVLGGAMEKTARAIEAGYAPKSA